MRPLFLAALVVGLLVAWYAAVAPLHFVSGSTRTATALAATSSTGIQMYSTEQAVQKQCSSDTVVRLDTNSGIYHIKGERWYGRTQRGAYVCKKKADAASYRETENGQ